MQNHPKYKWGVKGGLVVRLWGSQLPRSWWSGTGSLLMVSLGHLGLIGTVDGDLSPGALGAAVQDEVFAGTGRNSRLSPGLALLWLIFLNCGQSRCTDGSELSTTQHLHVSVQKLPM